jgi:UDP-glucose 4-epimerase
LKHRYLTRLVVCDAGNATLVASIIAEHRVDPVIHFAGSVEVPDSSISLLTDLVSVAPRIAALHQSDLLEVVFRVTVQ